MQFFVIFVFFVACICRVVSAEEPITLTTIADSPQRQITYLIPGPPSDWESFLVEVEIDPTDHAGGNLQSLSGIAIGAQTPEEARFPAIATKTIRFELREGDRLGFWDVWRNNVCESRREPNPLPPGWIGNSEYQRPWEFTPREGSYLLRIVGLPSGEGSELRFYFEFMDRPVFTLKLEERLRLGHMAYFSVCGGKDQTNVATFSNLKVEPITADDPRIAPSARDIVLEALDLSRPELKSVAEAMDAEDRELAGELFLRHMRTRVTPKGAPLIERDHGLNYLEVADAALENRYGTLGPFNTLQSFYIDGAGQRQSWVDDEGRIRWAYCHGDLTRHFHWCSLAKAYAETKDEQYARRFAFEVRDWVARDPHLHPRNPDIGGLNWMDGTLFVRGYMNTSNIGRRCEMTWWPSYEVFRKAEEFDDEAHFHMLLGFLRQSRLIMNPSSFAVHDDGGSHICVALLQNAFMLPEFKEAKRWEAEALRRWEEVLDVQLYPDGSHVSLSTGYNWASIYSFLNMIELYRRVERPVPPRFLNALETAFEHPMAISRPDQGQIDMNDGGWGMIDDHMRTAHRMFPERDDFLWMATKGEEGSPPEYTSLYFPNAGHFVLRTGWGPKERYLFMDAGPVGASHGKEDKLNISLDYGGHQLVASGGRGSYAGGPYAAYTGSTRGYNTVLVDGGVQSRIPFRHEIYGHTPEPRRFVTNDHFDYAEGFHTHGWYAADGHTQGKQTRQILFLKGENPPETSYWVVFDTVAPLDEREHTYEALFHIRRNHAELVDEKTKVVHAWDAAAALRILPAVTEGLEVELVRAQTEPHIQGWHVVGKHKAPMWTPTFRWRETGLTTRAWVLVPAGAAQDWCVSRTELLAVEPGLLVFRIHRVDGGNDLVFRRQAMEVNWPLEAIDDSCDVGVISYAADGSESSRLLVDPLGD